MRRRIAAGMAVGACLVAGCSAGGNAAAPSRTTGAPPTSTPTPTPTPTLTPTPLPTPSQPALDPAAVLLPVPAKIGSRTGDPFVLRAGAAVRYPGDTPSADVVARFLASLIRGHAEEIAEGDDAQATPAAGAILLQVDPRLSIAEEGYRLDVGDDDIVIRAQSAEGLFRGAQTLRQLLPVSAERSTSPSKAWAIRKVLITDSPRYRWRGSMLDVARHFRTVNEVERYLDLMALYKMNVLHLHLTDDQGWRIEIRGWPRLTSHGGSTAVDGGPGGFYTQAQYRAIVRYATQRFITVVPEIDGPAHTNAALSSYPGLSCDGKPRPLYTGTHVGFSSLCVGREQTYTFLDDVIGQVAALTPGRYLHIGGDEAQSTSATDYRTYIGRVQQIVQRHGKVVEGWAEIGAATLRGGKGVPPAVAQFWSPRKGADATVRRAADQGAGVVMSPADHAYLDMKYSASTAGLTWAGYTNVRDAYDWNPDTAVVGVPRSMVLGVEAPLWGETTKTMKQVEFLAFPRLAGIAELGWSAKSTHDWSAYRKRLAAQAPRWSVLHLTYYRSAEIDWVVSD